jgi:hypothetical protein
MVTEVISKSRRGRGLAAWLCLGLVGLWLALLAGPAQGAWGNIIINNGDTYTTSQTVTLTIYNLYRVSGVRFSNDGLNWSGGPGRR